jgi:hypothetical protein
MWPQLIVDSQPIGLLTPDIYVATNGYMKRGRKPKPLTERKVDLIRIRVTEDQKKMLSEAAEADGMDVSTWLRWLGLRAARRS